MTRNRRADWRRVKSLRSYTVDEAARTLTVHRGTIRHWIKQHGLAVLTDRRPHLILGRDLVAFLKARRAAAKSTCGPGELYCLKCRAPRTPVEGLLEFRRLSPTRGALVGLCGQCESIVHRFVSERRAAAIAGEFNVQIEPQDESLTDTAHSALNCHSGASDQP